MKKDTCKALISWLRVKLYHFHPCKRLLYQWFIGKTLTQFHKSCEYICVCGSWYFFPILVKNVSIFHTGHPLFTDSWPHNLNSVHCDCAVTLFLATKKAPGDHFTSGVLICRGQWVQKQVKRANFAQNRKFLPIFPDPFSEQSETLLVRPFCPLWYFLSTSLQTFPHI